MKRNTFVLATCVLITLSVIVAQKSDFSFNNNWKKVEEFARKQLPESALKVVNTILAEAQKRHRNDEVIKAMVSKMRFTLEKEPDKAPELIRAFEDFCNETTDPATQALLHSMTAELYAQYFENNRWDITRRTDINGQTPEDIREWTKNMFQQKVMEHLNQSTSNKAVLFNTNPEQFKVLLWKGRDSRKIEPGLYEFLLHRKIQILTSLEANEDAEPSLTNGEYMGDIAGFISMGDDKNATENEKAIALAYRDILKSLTERKQTTGLVIFNLERLEYFRNKMNRTDADSLHMAALTAFEQTYHQDENSVEIVAEMANAYLNYGSRTDRNFLYDQDYTNDEDNVSLEQKKKALQFCEEGIARFPKYKRIAILKNIRTEILQPSLSVSNKDIADSKTGLKLQIKTKNLTTVKLKLYRIETNAADYYLSKKEFQRTLILERTIAIDCREPLQNTLTEYYLKSPDYGIYEFQLQESTNKSKEAIAKGQFTVTDLAFIARQTEEGKKSIYVLDQLTGHPVKDVEVVCTNNFYENYQHHLDTIATLRSNASGACTLEYQFTKNISPVFFLRNNKDRFYGAHLYTYAHRQFENEETDAKISFMTDRAIYRPGQTVHFKLISYFSTKTRKTVNAKAYYDIELKDANAKVVTVKKVQTNEYGSASGTFVLPEGGLNGYYSLNTKNESYNFSVEEYKRPTFEVELEKPKTEISFGNKATLYGQIKSFAGVNIGDAQVKYRIVRRTSRFCWWLNQPEKNIAEGTVVSDAQGKFALPFNPEKTTKKSTGTEAYNYTIYVDATDPKGETQQGELSISVANQSLFITADVPDKIQRDANVQLDIKAQTSNDELLEKTLQYELIRLKNTDEYTENLPANHVFSDEKTVITGSYNTKDKKLLLNLSNLTSGRYKLVFATRDNDGKEIKTEKTFILYGVTDKCPPVKSFIWQTCSLLSCEYGDTAHLDFGTSATDTKVLYEVMLGNKILESKWMDISNEIKRINVPFLAEYHAGINVLFTFMKNGKLYSHKVQIQYKEKETKLTVKLNTFRNKLLPGEKTTWTVNVSGYKNSKFSAEVLASMYDASLDAFRKSEWYFNPSYNEPFWFSPHWSIAESRENTDAAYFPVSSYLLFDFDVNTLKWFGLSLINNYESRYFGHRLSVKFTKPIVKNDEEVFAEDEMKSQEEISNTKGVISIADVKGNDERNGKVLEEVRLTNVSKALRGKMAGIAVNSDGSKTSNQQSVTPRTNFNETAFFYPQLQTDSAGNVQFSFTAPESLTRWNVKMLAHTKDLYFGQNETQVVTQKELMVQMNLPRFVRRSDKLSMSASVVNLSGKAQTVNVAFEMIDPATNKSIRLKNAAPQTVTLAANETKVVSWNISEYSPYELVICKVVASSEQFSDGEQKYLPVLPDKVLLTESMPLIIRGGQTREFSFQSLMKNASNVETKNLSVEFSPNPTWYAVQALPTMAEPTDDNAVSLFTAYYANSLAGSIAESNPKLSAMFDRWKNEGGSREAFLSNLQKNAALKNMLLEETPWVMAAQNESEQKRQLGLLFDLNAQKNKNQQYWDKLLKLQLPSGGFSWFNGMPENQYITQWILLDMARLKRMTKQAMDEQQQMIAHALNYTDGEIAHRYDLLKKNNKNYLKEDCTGETELFYLLMRSEYPEYPIAKETQEASMYYLRQAEKYRYDYSIYGKAMMAVVFKRNGNGQLANEMLQSLKENALKTDEMGMYWAKNIPGYFWNERPIAVQAAIIDAYRTLEPNSADLDELKIWLLKQKQTQSWDNPASTTEAVYALLNNGTDWLSNDNNVAISVGGKNLVPESKEAGTGYFKQSLPVAGLAPSKLAGMSEVTVRSKPANAKQTSIGWGAMYWQFFQEQDKVEAQGGPLKVKKSLYVMKGGDTVTSGSSPQSNQMMPISQTTLKKGDKVITRLTVTTDRNLEYVALKDLRAACFEPVEQLSGCRWKEGVCYYQTSKDASTQFFFSFLPKGTYVFEYELWANNSGEYTSGITSLQCQYAPEFVSHSGGERITVK